MSGRLRDAYKASANMDVFLDEGALKPGDRITFRRCAGVVETRRYGGRDLKDWHYARPLVREYPAIILEAIADGWATFLDGLDFKRNYRAPDDIHALHITHINGRPVDFEADRPFDVGGAA